MFMIASMEKPKLNIGDIIEWHGLGVYYRNESEVVKITNPNNDPDDLRYHLVSIVSRDGIICERSIQTMRYRIVSPMKKNDSDSIQPLTKEDCIKIVNFSFPTNSCVGRIKELGQMIITVNVMVEGKIKEMLVFSENLEKITNEEYVLAMLEQ